MKGAVNLLQMSMIYFTLQEEAVKQLTLSLNTNSKTHQEGMCTGHRLRLKWRLH